MNNNMLDFKEKKFLIDGAGSGIGKKTAILLSQMGAKVVIIDSNIEGNDKTFEYLEGNSNKKILYDLSDLSGIETMVKKLILEFGPLDGFVHCVGLRSYRPLKMIDSDYLQTIMNVNFGSFMELCRCLTKKNCFNAGMSIVAVSSISAKNGGAGVSAYAASKTAIEGAIRSLAPELSKKNIRINSVQPGQTHTVKYDEILGGQPDPVLNRQYLGLAEPSDIANVIVFMLSNMSRMITGASIPIDGGYYTA